MTELIPRHHSENQKKKKRRRGKENEISNTGNKKKNNRKKGWVINLDWVAHGEKINGFQNLCESIRETSYEDKKSKDRHFWWTGEKKT